MDFASAPNSPSRCSEPGSSSSLSMPTTPSSAMASTNAFLFPHPAFAQYHQAAAAAAVGGHPSPTMRGFPGFFFAQSGGGSGLPGQATGSPTYFLPSIQDAYQQMPPPMGAFKRPSPMSDDDEGDGVVSSNANNGHGGETKRMKVADSSEGDEEELSNHSHEEEESVKSNGRMDSASPLEQQHS